MEIRDSWSSLRQGGEEVFTPARGWVRTPVCKRAFKCARVCRCALGLYHRRDDKFSGVICKLSGENFPAEALISFLLRLRVPKNTKSQPLREKKNMERNDNVLRWPTFFSSQHSPGIHLSVTANAPCLFNSACLFHSNQTRCAHKSRTLKV